MNEIVHPSILKLWESYEDDKRYYLVSEYCSGRELYDKIIQKDFKFADNEIKWFSMSEHTKHYRIKQPPVFNAQQGQIRV